MDKNGGRPFYINPFLLFIYQKYQFILSVPTDWGYLPSRFCVHVFPSPLACNLDVHVCIEQQVLSLQVSVDDAALVAVLHGWQNLPELSPCFSLTQPPMASQVIWKCSHRDKCCGMPVTFSFLVRVAKREAICVAVVCCICRISDFTSIKLHKRQRLQRTEKPLCPKSSSIAA